MEIKKTGKEMSEGKTEYTMKDGGFFIFRTIESDETSTRINGLLLLPTGGRGVEREIKLNKPVKSATEAWNLLKEEGY